MSQWDLSYTQNRELSWLKFNERVLAEAADTRVPLIERLRFASIFTSNLDEFFMVRVGSLFDLMMIAPDDVENKSGMTPAQQLDKVFDAVRPLIARRDEVYQDLTKELARVGVQEIEYDELTESQRSYVHDYYKDNIRAILSPQIIDYSHPFPHLKNKELYVAALLGSKGKRLLGIIDVPISLPPILMLPGTPVRYVRTEAIIAAHMRKIFKIYDVEEEAVISVTRNADISLDEEKFDEDNPDFLNYMAKLLRKRERLAPVRLEIQGNAPGLQKMLCASLKLEDKQVYKCRCPLKLNYAYMLDKCAPSLYYPPHAPLWPEYLDHTMPMRAQIQQRDVLLFYPYQSIQPFLDLLKQSAADPQVVSIKITIYRLAHNSAIAKALCEAAENGKEVTVLMELRARFDEQNNIDWAREMEEAGCRIIYGQENCKCHAKICLITRREKNGYSYITQIGTGNYNEKTSTLYTDFCMMTA
ncbi:MAG: polyphosphate kinase 1, partial [Clostridia bacterium]|nr:polyphosphate kinase 1 [Clostridia bacterium]